MICNNCGTHVPDGSERCYYCGAPMAVVPVAQLLSQEEKAPVYEEPAKQPSVCSNCGTPLTEGSRYCIGCGKEIPEESDTVDSKPEKSGTSGKKSGSGKMIAIVTAGAVTLIALVIILVVALGGSDAEAVAEDFYTAIYEGDVDGVLALLPEEVLDYERATTREITERVEYRCDWALEYCEDEYGKDRDFEVESIHVNQFDRKKLRNKNESYEEKFDMEIEEAAEVIVLIVYEGEDTQFGETIDTTVVKVNGEWYIDVFDFM